MALGLMLVCVNEETKKSLTANAQKENFPVKSISSLGDLTQALVNYPEVAAAVIELAVSQPMQWQMIEKIRDTRPKFKFVLLSPTFNAELYRQAVVHGVNSVHFGPFSKEEIWTTVSKAIRDADSERYTRELLEDLQSRVLKSEGLDEDKFWYVAKSKAMEPVNEWLTVLRRESMKGGAEPSVLISAETGGGEDGIARMVYAASRRGRKTWFSLNCSSMSEEQLDAELFGFEKSPAAQKLGIGQIGADLLTLKRGAIEAAHGGIIYLKNIEALSESIQSKLIAFLQTRTFRRIGGGSDLHSDVRFISSMSVKPDVRSKSLKEDLLRQLSQMSIRLPALRERKEDLLPMAITFARKIFKLHNKNFTGFTSEAETALSSYSWPGNVEELYAVIERASLLCKADTLVSVTDLSLGREGLSASRSDSYESSVDGTSQNQVPTLEEGLNYTALKKKWCDSFEKEFLVVSLKRNSGNVSAAAREAKLDRSNFLRLLRRHGLKAENFRRISHVPPVAPVGNSMESAA